MNNKTFNLSANLETGVIGNSEYFVTPNVQKVLHEIVTSFQTGIHSFSIIGAYGTGKSSFLINLEKDLAQSSREKLLLKNPKVLSANGFEFINIVGDYCSLDHILARKMHEMGLDEEDSIEMLKTYCGKQKKKGKLLVIVIDEFGKLLEHAAKCEPEKEIYFFQKFTEIINAPQRNVLLLTTLHQNFSAYASKLNTMQKNEWTKVKGRFQEIVFAEPIEQLLFLAAEFLQDKQNKKCGDEFCLMHKLAVQNKYMSASFNLDTAIRLYPLDAFAAYTITKAIQRYGQNERSLFSFLTSKGENSLSDFKANSHLTYNLAEVYDYIVNNFYSSINDVNSDAMSWSAIKVAIERIESNNWVSEKSMLNAIKISKAIGLMNLFGNAGFSMSVDDMILYASKAMNIDAADEIIHELLRLKIIRFAEYKKHLILFEGTDINIEEEIEKATSIIPMPEYIVDDMRSYFKDHVIPVKKAYMRNGTPRFFEYQVLSEFIDLIPEGATDGYIQLIFSIEENYLDTLLKQSASSTHANICAYFSNTEILIRHLYAIKKYQYIIDVILVDKTDKVAIKELNQLIDYEKTLLNKEITESLYSYKDKVVWIYRGKKQNVKSLRDLNKLLSKVSEDVYYLTPIINNELLNKHKLSSNISAAKQKYFQALLDNGNKVDLGFESDKFPPEKTIYFTLLRNTGLHIDGEFSEYPSSPEIKPLWDACENFLHSTIEKPRKLSELVKILSTQPYKLKDGLLEFWLPTYLYIKRQDYSLFGDKDQYIPNFSVELFDLMKKHIGGFKIKAYAVDGLKLQLFNQYRKFLNLDDKETIRSGAFIETIKPFLFFYNKQLNDYAKHTKKLDHRETIKFRDVLSSAKDPEKAFLEDLPNALGYNDEQLRDTEKMREYCDAIQRSVKELRNCYNNLIDRIENNFVKGIGVSSFEYQEYINEVRKRLSKVKTHLLTSRQKEFYQHIMTKFDNRLEWYQSVCYAVMGSPLNRMRDEQEPQLLDDMVFLFRECERQSVISEGLKYKIDSKEEKRSAELERKIDNILSGDANLDIYTLTKILQKRINND